MIYVTLTLRDLSHPNHIRDPARKNSLQKASLNCKFLFTFCFSSFNQSIIIPLSSCLFSFLEGVRQWKLSTNGSHVTQGIPTLRFSSQIKRLIICLVQNLFVDRYLTIGMPIWWLSIPLPRGWRGNAYDLSLHCVL